MGFASSISRRALAGGFALALACLLLSAPQSGSAGSTPALTLKAKQKELSQGGSTRLTGKLTGASTGNADRPVTLIADPYPYGSESIADAKTTGPDGAFAFRVEPELNTSYRVEFMGPDGAAASPDRNVYVFESVRFRLRDARGDYRVRALYDLRYSPEVQPEHHPGKKAYFYFRKTTQSTFKRVEVSRWKNTASGVASKAVVKLPKSRKGYRYRILGCTKYPARDIGIGPPVKSGCPRKIRVRSAAARLASGSLDRVAIESGP